MRGPTVEPNERDFRIVVLHIPTQNGVSSLVNNYSKSKESKQASHALNGERDFGPVHVAVRSTCIYTYALHTVRTTTEDYTK